MAFFESYKHQNPNSKAYVAPVAQALQYVIPYLLIIQMALVTI